MFQKPEVNTYIRRPPDFQTGYTAIYRGEAAGFATTAAVLYLAPIIACRWSYLFWRKAYCEIWWMSPVSSTLDRYSDRKRQMFQYGGRRLYHHLLFCIQFKCQPVDCEICVDRRPPVKLVANFSNSIGRYPVCEAGGLHINHRLYKCLSPPALEACLQSLGNWRSPRSLVGNLW